MSKYESKFEITRQLDYCTELSQTLDGLAKENFSRPERFMLARALKRCGLATLPEPKPDPDGFLRCDGRVACTVCGYRYQEHPMDWRVIGYDGMPFLHIVCDGTRVKL